MLYRFPMYKRLMVVDDMGCMLSCVHVDAIGAFVRHNKKEDLRVNNLRRYICGRTKFTVHVMAANPSEALANLSEEFPGMRIGGKPPEGRAMWIDDSEPIVELPVCSYLSVSEEGCFRCGEMEPSECCLDSWCDCWMDDISETLLEYDDYRKSVDDFHGCYDRYEMLLKRNIDNQYIKEVIQGHIFMRKGIDAVHLSLWPSRDKGETGEVSRRKRIPNSRYVSLLRSSVRRKENSGVRDREVSVV